MKLVKGIAAVGLSLMMVLQTNAPALNAWAQTVQAEEKSGVSTYSGETYADEENTNKADSTTSSAGTSTDSKSDAAGTGDSNKGTDDSGASAGNGSDSKDDQDQNSDGADSGDTDDAADDAADDSANQPAEQSVAGLDTIEGLTAALGEGNYKLSDDGKTLTEVNIPSGRADLMILLSNADASLYDRAAISDTDTGSVLNLTSSTTCIYNGRSLTYQGLGSKEYPFKGTVSSRTYRLDRSLFKYYSPQDNATINLQFGKTQTNGLLADHVKGDGHTIAVTCQFSSGSTISVPLCGEVDSALALKVTFQSESGTGGYVDYKVGTAISLTNNAGLIAGTVDVGASLTLESISKFKPVADTSVTSQSGNAGLLVGELADGATFETCGLGSAGTSFNPISPKGTISAAKGCAGGLVGKAGDGATVKVAANEVNLSKMAVEGSAAGGLIGGATNLTLDLGNGKVDPAATIGSASSVYAGGLFGQVSFMSDYEIPGNSKIVLPSNGFTLKSKQFAGGLFGEITLNGNVTFNRDDLKSVLSAVDGDNVRYGGIAGRLRSAKSEAEFLVKDAAVSVSMNGSIAGYYGGLIGIQGEGSNSGKRVALKTEGTTNVEVANDSSLSPKLGFGGAVGCVCEDATVDLAGFTLNTNGVNITTPTRGVRYSGGIAGEMYPGAILRMRGITDLSNASYADGDRLGQLVGLQSSALVYATGSGQDGDANGNGWTLNRTKSAVGIDDIAVYGEVIRLNKDASNDSKQGLSHDLITLGIDHKAKISQGSAPYTSIAGNDDFARVAIVWQTKGAFNGCNGLSSWDVLSSANLKLVGSVDLTGTGIIGFMRDTSVNDSGMGDLVTYGGTFDGGDKTVKLAIGEPYGQRDSQNIESDDTSEGNGKIYRHNRLGLFSLTSGSVKNLTIEGSMRFTAKAQIQAGGYSARLESGAPELSGVTSKVSIDCASEEKQNIAYVGELYGVIASGARGLTFKAGSGSGTAAKVGNTVNGSIVVSGRADRIVFGGAIGQVEGDSPVSITVESNGLELSGSIEAAKTNSAADNIAGGGFIGVMAAGNARKTVNLSGLVCKNLSLSAPSSNSMGGLLGYAWTNADVTFANGGLSASEGDTLGGARVTSGTSTSTGSISSAGGLVYKASGKWQIKSGGIDLAGYTISNISNDLGLLVCRGGANKEAIAGTEARTEGLYLEVAAAWDGACVLNENIFSSNSSINFDEWVCSTVDTTGDSGSQNNVLSAGYNGVVSLKTNGSSVVMDGSARNTYVNRTKYGQSHQTNVNTRYYYNLDTIKTDVNEATGSKAGDGKIDTPQELMLWSVIKYADNTIRSYFYSKDGADCASGKNLTELSDALDLKGYSYYPVDVTDTDLTIDSATITFYNDKIESSESKTNNKTTVAGTQHLAMHAGLIRNFAKGSPYKLNVSDTTFKGSIGMMTGGNGSSYNYGSCSGALICGDAYGSLSDSGTKNICAINIKDCRLSDLSVSDFNKDGYAPLLINGMGTYFSLTVDGITTDGYTAGANVATSLFGNLGSENATQVTATFSHIAIPAGKDDAIFSKASILNSFSYSTGAQGIGSATYTFTKEDQTNKKVTFGQEIDRKETEYSGKQLWYFDEDTYGDEDGLVNDGSGKADADAPHFGDYLPYVYSSKKTDGQAHNHEIKVNQRLEDLTKGCGTYADPYVISKEATLEALASYVGDNAATDGWRITIAADQSQVCTRRSGTTGSTDNEVTYVYSAGDGDWHKDSVQGEALSNSAMHRYIQSCYIDINDANSDHNESNRALEVKTSKFTGLGSQENPFRGVITSTSKTKLVINNDASTFSGLIKYSYGCVVKDLTIEYTGSPDTVNYASASNAIPGAFFGGVFGLILGGDNIIDGVNISTSGSFAVKAAGSASMGTSTSGSAKSYLVPIGGYVGAIAGGGVIFRGSIDESWHKDAGSDYYNNPVVGRVLDGYAFTEGNKCNVGDNTVNGKAANYKLVKLDDSYKGTVTTGDLHNSRIDNDNTATTTTVSNAKGLLLLSAIINSGATAGPLDMASPADDIKWAGTFNGTNAYAGTKESNVTDYAFGNGGYGKTRNATYNNIGKPNADAGDFDLSKIDDQKVPGLASPAYPHQSGFNWDGVNAPYLVNKYCSNKKTMYICGAGYSSFDLQLAAGGDFDMTSYGNTYRGLSGCYYTNALKDDLNRTVTNGARSNYARDRAIPWVAHIGGNNNVLKVDMQVNEYADDDFKSAGVGALFSYAMFTGFNVSTTTKNHDGVYIENLTISDSTIQHKLSGNSEPAPTWGVGGIAGVALVENTIKDAPVKVSNVNVVSNTTVTGPSTAGGFFGNAGVYGRFDPSGTTDESLKYPIAPDSVANGKGIAFEFNNCSYSDLKVTGGQHTGGFVGQIKEAVGELTNKVSVTDKTVVLGKDSSVTTTAGYLGGVFGTVNAPLKIEGSNGATAKIVDVSAATGNWISAVGGFVGNAGGTFEAQSLQFTTLKSEASGYPTLKKGGRSAVGGILGDSSASKSLTFTDCVVEKVKAQNDEGAGGIVGNIQSSTVNASDITVQDVTFSGSDTGGFVGLGLGNTVSVKNAKIRRNSFSDRRASWGNLPNQSGGFSGDTKGTFRLSNILIDSCVFSNPDGQGIIAGNARAESESNCAHIYVAGLEVRKPTGDNASKFPSKLFNTEEQGPDVQKIINNGSFVSFANYNGNAVSSNGPLYNDAAADSATDGTVDPYVTTSPVALEQAQLGGGDSTTGGYLFGDGANVDIAQTIIDGSNPAADTTSGVYAYVNTAGTDRSTGERKKATALTGASSSTLAANNTDLKAADGSAIAVPKLKVLQVNGGSSGAVEGYLNIVTNGGFSDAVANNDGSNNLVTATVRAFKVSDDRELVPSGDTANVTVRGNGTNRMAFDVSSQFDNGKGTFTLVTLTFKVGKDMEHKVMVPVVVRRLLETTMTATFVDGTSYYEDAYKFDNDGSTRLLADYGTSATALVTLRYNYNNKERNEDSKGRSEYGWDSYLAAGGDMSQVSRFIIFNNTSSRLLPAGTLLTLVDKDDDGRVYTDSLVEDGNVLDLSKFKEASGDVGYGKWMSELMGVSAEEDEDGNWVKIDTENGGSIDEAKARVKTDEGYDYYKPITSGAPLPSGTKKYTLNCKKDDNDGKEISPSENFYLTVYIPKDKAPSYNINGNLDAKLSCGTVNFDTISHALRSSGNTDNQSGTASTYNFTGGYSQSLSDSSSDVAGSPKVPDATTGGAGYGLHMDVVDTVTFSSEQVYDEGDSLYYRFESTLSNYANDSFSGGTNFPVGCSGMVEFYVYTEQNGVKTYYGPSETSGLAVANSETAAFTKNWSSNGGAMKIDVGRDLKVVREASKETGYKFYIEAKGDIHMSEEAFKVAIASAQKDTAGKVSAYTKLNYRGTLSNTSMGLDASTLMASKDGDARYYREDKDGARISLTANKTDQLGINVNDLNSAGDGNIGATVVYDLTRTPNTSEAFGKISSIRYTLTLEKRAGTNGSYTPVSNLSDYISVTSKELGAGTGSAASTVGTAGALVWTDTVLKTKDSESQKYKLSLDIKVNTTVTEFANYRVRVTAQAYDSGGTEISSLTPWNNNYVGSDGENAHSDYITYTLTRVNLKGITGDVN